MCESEHALALAVEKLIAPKLGRFRRAHPDVVLDIAIDDGLSDIGATTSTRATASPMLESYGQSAEVAFPFAPTDRKFVSGVVPGKIAETRSNTLVVASGLE